MSHYNSLAPVLAERLINTQDTTRSEPEFLRAPADLAHYLAEWSIPLAQPPDAQDLAAVLDLRRRLRAVFEWHDMTVAVELLNELLDGISVEPRVGLAPDGSIKLELEVEKDLPLARRLGAEAALGLCAAIEQHGIERFHVCSAAPCSEVYIDTSRNHTRRYCCVQCANRHNVASHRQRRRAT